MGATSEENSPLSKAGKDGEELVELALDLSAERRRPGDPLSVMERRNGEGEDEGKLSAGAETGACVGPLYMGP